MHSQIIGENIIVHAALLMFSLLQTVDNSTAFIML